LFNPKSIKENTQNVIPPAATKLSSVDRFAHIIRIITVPPVLVILLILFLYHRSSAVFQNQSQVALAVILLGIVPVLAYPVQKIIPFWKQKGREGQRTLAFILSLAGYLAAVITGLLLHVSLKLQFINLTYLVSVTLLSIFNKGFHTRASGHACSVTGPMLFLIYFLGWHALIPCIIVGFFSLWASYHLKRHTAKDLAMGVLTCMLSFALSYLFYFH
jgi:hypothetical protein